MPNTCSSELDTPLGRLPQLGGNRSMPTDCLPDLPGLGSRGQSLLDRATPELRQVLLLSPGPGVGPTQD